MPNLTPNYSYNLPLVADPIDADLWGGQLNANWSSIDTTLKAVSDVANTSLTFYDIGDLKPTARATAPAKWLFADGTARSRTTYAALFAAIGTTYGVGDGSTTFNVPDLRGRSGIGKDNMGGSAANRVTTAGSSVDGATLGASGGNQLMQNHTHTLTDPGHVHAARVSASGSSAGAFFGDGSGGGPVTATGAIQTATTGITIASAGTGASQNMQPVLVINWLIFSGV